MKQTLYLLRHAKSEPWTPGIDDFGRVLSQRGREHMEMLADWLQGNLPAPEAVLCSSAHRARETLTTLFRAWPGLAEKTVYSDDIYEATGGGLHALAEQAFESVTTVLMVGHNPGFETLALAVMHEADAAGVDKMATGTLAIIEFPRGYSTDCGQGKVIHWVKRNDLLTD